MDDSSDMGGITLPTTNSDDPFDGNSLMIFPSAVEPAFTKTPANVKGDYVSSTSTSAPAPAPVHIPAKRKTATPKKGAQQVKKRKTGKKAMASRAIPRSFEECSEPDQMLIRKRDEGSDWNPIRKEWKEMTGESTATSTLPNRYARLKSNFTVIREEDNALLLSAKREVEESFEAQKWDLVARVVAEKGGDTYAGVVLKRQYKKLMVTQAMCEPPEGVRDPDFEVEELPAEDSESEEEVRGSGG